MEVLNSSAVPRVKFIVDDKNLILAGISVSRSNSCPASGRLVGRTVPTRYSFCVSAIILPPFMYAKVKSSDLITCREQASSVRAVVVQFRESFMSEAGEAAIVRILDNRPTANYYPSLQQHFARNSSREIFSRR